MLGLKVLALLLCIYGCFGQTQMYSTPFPCVAYYGVNNAQADLSPLMSYTDYVIYNGTQAFWLNMCRSVITNNCGSGIAGCFQPSIYGGQFDSMGRASSMYFTWVTQYSGIFGLSATYNGGDYYNYVASSMQIDFTCVPGGGVGVPSFLAQNTTTGVFYFSWPTQYACFNYMPSHSHTTTVNGFPIFIVFGVLAILFCIAGCCVHMCKRRRQREMMKRRLQAVDIPMDTYPANQRQVAPTPQPQQLQQLQQLQQPYPYMPVYPVQYYPGAPMTSVPMASPYPQYYVPSYTAIPQQEQQQMVPQVQLDKLDE